MDKIPASHKIGVILAWIVVVATGGCSEDGSTFPKRISWASYDLVSGQK